MNNQYIAHKRKATKLYPEACQSLETHLIEVGDLSHGFAEKIGLAGVGQLLGLLHDFGKYSQEFQSYIGSATGEINPDEDEYVDAANLKGKIDHSSAGAQFIWRQFSGAGKQKEGDLIGQIIALCIASHHSGLIDCFDKNCDPKFTQRMEKADEYTHLQECLNNGDADLLLKIKQLATGTTCTIALKKIFEIAEFNSEHTNFSRIGYFNLGFFTRFLFSGLIDADRLNSAEFENPQRKEERHARHNYFNWQTAIQRVEGYLAGLSLKYPIDELRKAISENCYEKSQQSQGVYTLSVPTGGGKTLASLRYAVHHGEKYKLDRIIYIVPYTSIIEQNAAAIREVIEEKSDRFPWVLEHHSNLEPERQTWKSKLVSENWDSPVVLTTMVQFLETCFTGGTRSVRRLHQMANSVIIFDEIQTLPVNCTHLFCNALNFLVQYCRTTAVLCTATQPLLDKVNKDKGSLTIPAGSEIVDDVSYLFKELERVEIHNRIKQPGWSLPEIAELALTQLQQLGSCLVIVNTKSWARDLYQRCLDQVEKDAIFHLSTNQCPVHRKYILDIIRKRLSSNKPVLCISTQLIEAGVDISFASVIRFLAGLDSIAQAAGRCNRHGEAKDTQGQSSKGQVFVVNPDSETTGLLKDIEAGKEAANRVLNDGFSNLVAPKAMEQYFNYYFYGRANDMVYNLNINKLGRTDTLLNLLSDNCKSQLSFKARLSNGLFPLMSQSFMEAGKQFQAIDAPTHAVIVPYGEGKNIIAELCAVDKEFNAGRYYELLKKAQKYSVNTFPNVWEKLLSAGDAIREVQDIGVYCLNERYYDKDFGLSETYVALMENYNV